MSRRFQRRIHIAVPDLPGRIKMFELSVGSTPCTLTSQDYRSLGQMSEGYTGSDINIAVQDALMQPVRKIQTATHYRRVSYLSPASISRLTIKPKVKTQDGAEKLTPCSPGAPGAMEMTWVDVDPEALLEPPLELKDFVKAVKMSRPTVSKADIQKSDDWTKEFGSEA